MNQSPNPPPPRRRDPSALTSEYHKAHKQLMLWSGILFIWELIGVDLDKAKDAGGNVGAAVSILKSPQAVPWALVILVGYFLFKLIVEWMQNAEERRAVRYARMDYISALVVAGASLLLYGWQTVSHLQLANTASGGGATPVAAFVVGFGVPMGLAALGVNLIGQKGLRMWVALTLSWVLTAILITVIVLRATEPNWKWCYLGLVVNIVLIIAATFLAKDKKDNPKPPETPGEEPRTE